MIDKVKELAIENLFRNSYCFLDRAFVSEVVADIIDDSSIFTEYAVKITGEGMFVKVELVGKPKFCY